MCGRYVIGSAPEELRAYFGYMEQPNFPARYNVAPTQPVPIVRLDQGKRHFALVRWGLIPSWVDDPKTFSLCINARAESVLDKPAFRAAMRRRRCLFPADGFYEWRASGGKRQPYFVRLRSGTPMAFAGLWETWMGPNGEEMETAAIVTTQAIHERMPVILFPDAFDFWLDCDRVDAQTAAALLVPVRDALIEAYEISPAVNRVTNDSPDLIRPATAYGQAAAELPAATRRRKAKKDDRQSSLF